MRKSTIVMIGFAVLFGLLAVLLAQSWLRSQAEKGLRNLEAQQQKPAPTSTIVVASKALRFGEELGANALRELPWPVDAVPAGAFRTIDEITSGSARRVALTPIEINEPILASKITGPGQRATLSATITEGMKAVTIRVNDVDGVAGFVLPGDRVDIALTRQKEREATTDVVLQNIRVLAIDQTADERNEKPSVAKAVTLEVDTTAAQKLALAATVGNLSLMLRKAGEAQANSTRTITLSDLFGIEVKPKVEETTFATVKVHRPDKKQDYTVPAERAGALATTGRGETLR